MSNPAIERQMAADAEKERLDQIARREHFDRLYFRWLEARASLANPAGDNSDDVMDAKQDDVDEAGRQLLSAPAVLNWMVWMKWEVLEFCINQDTMDGKHIDNRSVVALATIKADLMRFGVGNAE
jgi:hypothetical protein